VNLIHRPRFGPWLCVAVWAVCAFTLARELVGGAADGLRFLPILALVSLLVWATFWNPRIEVTDGGVVLVNVLRTIDLPWPAIQRIDTKWALTLFTAYGSFTAWAAPAPGVTNAARLSGGGVLSRRAVPNSAMMSHDTIRPGDLPGSPSGDAAASLRRHWESLRDAGYLDNPQLEFQRVPVRWHVGLIAALVLLLAACVLAGVL
jgi:hypothetical protein